MFDEVHDDDTIPIEVERWISLDKLIIDEDKKYVTFDRIPPTSFQTVKNISSG